MSVPDALEALDPVVEALEKLNVPYYIGGSIVSSAYGVARATLDADLVCDLKMQQVRPLVSMLEGAYYVDEGMIRDAIGRRSSFNLVHLETTLKVDIFVVKDDPFHWEALRRRRQDSIGIGETSRLYSLSSPEDIVLFKLDWYRKGDETLGRQWTDVLGVLKVQGEGLDMEYLRKWAAHLGILDLVERAIRDVEAGSE